MYPSQRIKREFTTTDRRFDHTNITNKAGISDKKSVQGAACGAIRVVGGYIAWSA
jgi:hypothetical protein